MKQTKQINMKKFNIWYQVGMVAFAFFIGVFMKYQQHGEWLHKDFWIPFSIVYIVSSGIGYLAMFMVKKAATMRRAQLKNKIIPGVLIFYAGSYIVANFAITFATVLAYIVKDISFHNFWHNLYTYELSFGNKRLFGWLVFFTVAFFYALWRNTASREQKLVEENLKYKYNVLKAHVNPHFLFNSLNSLSELVHVSAEKSEAFIEQLSKIYRYLIENESKDWISLQDELDFVNRYFDLQMVRKEHKVQLIIDADSTENKEVIPASIQLLVENAIKHNSFTAESPLLIKVHVEEDNLTVSNPIRKKSVLPNGTQTGLDNLEQRVELSLAKPLRIKDDGKEFSVILPLKTS